MKDLVFFFRTSAYLKERWRIQWNLLNCDMSTLRANYITFYFLSSLGWEFSIQFFLEFGDVYHKTDSHVLVKHLLGNLIDLTLGLFEQEKKKNRENLWTKTGGNPCTHIIEVVKILKKMNLSWENGTYQAQAGLKWFAYISLKRCIWYWRFSQC